MSKMALLGIALIACIGYLALDQTKTYTKTSYEATQLAAVDAYVRGMEVLYNEKVARGIYDATLDPYSTGLIGVSWPGLYEQTITTTLGTYEAKRISTNPNFAALIVRYFQELNLRQGDAVAVNFSGSFPALNLAVMVALEEMKLTPYVFASVGASTYGANMVDFTWIDMHEVLIHQGIITHPIHAVSLGGDNDGLNENQDTAFKEELINRYKEKGYTVIEETHLQTNIQLRYKMYRDSLTQIKVFINTGGNMVAMGSKNELYPTGLVKRRTVSVNAHSGLIDLFLRDDVPLIHLLNIRDLALRNGLSTQIDEPFLPYVGEVYYEYSYSKMGIYAYWGIILAALIHDFRKRLGQKENINYV